jgi:probable HAF family extracellular repeat protein
VITAAGPYHPFTYSGGTMTDLGLINNLMTQFEAINNTGGAAGSDQNFHAFVYSNGTGTSLGTLGGPRSFATGINDVGTVVGWSDANFSNPAQSHAFSYSISTGIMTDLGTLNGSTFSTADAINNSGTAAGFAINGPNGFNNAVTFNYGGTITDLGTIGGQYPYSIANAINNAGVAVGSSSMGGETGSGYPVGSPGQLAVIYNNGRVTDLNTLVSLPGIQLAEAMGINDLGQIVANDDNGRAYLLTPIPGEAPGVATQPVLQSTSAGSSATFTVTGSGGSLSYEWDIGGSPLTDGTQPDGSVISGAGTASMTITNVQADENNASLTVEVYNPLGSVTSAAATLTVSYPLGALLYTAVDLGDLGGGRSYGMGINNSGTVVGYSLVPGILSTPELDGFPGQNLPDGSTAAAHAFSYSNGAMTDLGTLGGPASSADAVDSAGDIVGWSYTDDNGNYHPFIYHAGATVDLGALDGVDSGPSTGNVTEVNAMNNTGAAVGSDGPFHAFVYSNGTGVELGTLGGARSFATGVNDSGTVVGWSDTTLVTSSEAHGFSYSISGASMTDLGTLNGGTFSQAEGINNAGVAVGYAINGPSGYNHAVTFSNGAVIDLGVLGGAYMATIGNAINNLGTAVGSASYGGGGGDRYPVGGPGELAVSFTDGLVTDLNTVVDLPGVTLAEAGAINDLGQIVADGTNGRAYLLTPIPGAGPGISTQPASQSAFPGLSASFSVVGSGSFLSYQWYLNGVALTDGTLLDGSTVSGSATSSLSIADLQTDEDNAVLTVTVTNALGSVESGPAILSVTDDLAPVFTASTPWQNVFAGNSATFTVAALGAPSYQWQESTDGGATWNNLADGGAISGSSTATLTVGGVTTGMSGYLFRAVATDAYGSTNSPDAPLNLVPVPTATGITWGESDTAYYLPLSTPKAIAGGVADVELGGTHTAFLKADGTLWVTGGNAYGQLGDGTTVGRDTPEQVATGVAQVSAGGYHTMFIKTDGTLWGMGYNYNGQLGIGTVTDSWVPVQVPGATGVIAVAAGFDSTLFLTSDGALWAMGDDSWGELGDGGTVQQNSPIQVATGVSAISSGNNNQTSFFVKTDGTLWAMGNNLPGAIGDGTTNTAFNPEQVATGVATVSSNGYDTLFLKTDGSLWGMGYDGDSQFGDGEKFAESIPVEVASGVAHYSIGRDHTTFVKTDGTLWVTGNNGLGALGNPAITGIQITPVQVATGVADVAAMYSTLFVTTDGTLWACGDDTFGELGDNQLPTGAVEISPNGFVEAQIGSQANSLFLKADGTVWEQPGGDFAAPLVQLPGASDVVQVVSACYNQRQLFLRADGTLWQFAAGGIYSTPTQVASGVISAAAGEDYIAYLKSDGTLWAQGGDGWAIEFGDGTDPVQVDDHVVSFSAPGWVLLYVKSDGTLWGQGFAWNDGLAPSNNYVNPVSSTILLDTGVTWVDTNINQILFTTPDGTLWTLGDGFGPYGVPPVAVDSGTTTAIGDGVVTLYLKADAVLRSRTGYQGTLGPVVDVASGVVAVNGASDASGENVFIQTIGSGTAPTITAQPQSAVVQPGTSLTLQVSVDGTGPLSYLWYKNGAAVSWAQTPQFPIPDVTQADLGTYYVVITNSAGQVTSATVTVEVGPGAAAVTPWQTVFAGNNATFTVTAPGATSYQWQESTDGGGTWSNVANGGAFSGSQTATLTVGGVTSGMSGDLFRAVATNDAGSVTSAGAALTVVAPPTASGITWGENDAPSFLQVTSPKAITGGVSSIAVGGAHTAFLKSDGSLWVTGGNSFGQLGDGTTAGRDTPEQVATGVVRVAAGYYHTMFIKADGTLWGMGQNSSGQLGIGNTTNSSVPVQVPGATGVTAVAASGGSTLFIKSDGTLWAMGDDSFGELGDGSTTNQDSPIQVSSGVTAIAGGTYQPVSYFVKSDGSLWAVGDNQFGNLGDGTTNNAGSPEQVATGVVSVSSNGESTLFLKIDGTLWGMGQNSSGQLGDGTTTSQYSPVQVASGVASYGAGNFASAFVKTDGTLWVMGSNSNGELGIPAIAGNQTTPVQLASGVATVAAQDWTLYVDSSGVLWGTGFNTDGELGDGQSPTGPLEISPSGFVEAQIGSQENSIYLKADGTVWEQPEFEFSAPLDQLAGASDVVQVISSCYNARQLFLKSDGTLWQFEADGTYTAPFQVASGVVYAAAGLDYIAYIKTDGTLWAQGGDGWAIEFGDGTDPVQVDDHVVSLSAPGWVLLYVKSDGTLWGQGAAWNDGLAPGQNFDNPISSTVLLDAGVTWVDTNINQILFTTTDGTLWTMGDGFGLAGTPPMAVDSGTTTATGDGTGTYYLKPDGILRYRAGNPFYSPGPVGPIVDVAQGVVSVDGASDDSTAFAFIQTIGSGTAPAITAQPQSAANVQPGSSLTLQVSVSGTGPLGYQWYRNGAAVSWALGAQYLIPYVTPADAGTYHVVITNSAGHVTSANATVSLHPPQAPKITTQPQSQTVDEGATATFTVVATGSPPPTYQWYLGGVLLPGATSPTLTISDSQLANAGSYTVVVANSVSSVTSKAAKLTVDAAPAITAQPQSQTVVAGNNVTFSVGATGYPAPTYQWSLNGAPVSGATKASLTLNNVKAASAGTYTVAVTNSFGSVTSAGATLVVDVAPTITTQPASQTVDEGNTATFTVVAAGTPAPTYQWFLGGIPLSGATSSTLTISNVQPTNAGTYTVIVTNSVSSVTSKAATLTVDAAPSITAQPQSQTVAAGSSVTFSVVATGNPAPTYQWSLNGTPLSGATKANLTLNNVKAANDGTYTVAVTNALGSVTSAGATLVVDVAPVITTQPASQTVDEGNTATFTVVATGTPAPTYQWYLGGIPLSGATSSTLTIGNVQPANAGSYTVIVTNSISSVTSKAATLTVDAAPSITAQPQSQTVAAGSSVTFSVVASGNPAPTYQWSLNGTPLSGATKANLTLNNVKAANDGTYTVAVTNALGSVTSAGATLTVTLVQ